MLFYFYRIGLKNVATDKSRSSQVDNKIHSMVASVNPTLYGGGHSGFGLWSLPEWSEGPQMLAQFIYDNENWFYEKKISKFFQFFFKFFQFFGHPSCTKRFFCTFGQKITFNNNMSIWLPSWSLYKVGLKSILRYLKTIFF